MILARAAHNSEAQGAINLPSRINRRWVSVSVIEIFSTLFSARRLKSSAIAKQRRLLVMRGSFLSEG
jgi:hypothetical protein